eukprot:1637116-Rhodomonas_salina.1
MYGYQSANYGHNAVSYGRMLPFRDAAPLTSCSVHGSRKSRPARAPSPSPPLRLFKANRHFTPPPYLPCHAWHAASGSDPQAQPPHCGINGSRDLRPLFALRYCVFSSWNSDTCGARH